MSAAPSVEWLSAAELAELSLPGLPRNKRQVSDLAAVERWAVRRGDYGLPLARKRVGRGGGLEYHIDLLPAPARQALETKLALSSMPDAANDAPQVEQAWDWFARQSEGVKAEAERRLAIILDIERAVESGATKTIAIREAIVRWGGSPATIHNWFAEIKSVALSDRLPFLAPRRVGGGKEVEIDANAWQILKSDYLRPEQPTFASCYYRLLEDYAAPRGMELPHPRTLQRRLEKEVERSLKIAKRNGREALRRSVPAQSRTVKDLHAMKAVNIDGHMFDVFVRWPDGRVGRPVMVGIQDIYSRKLLAWRIGETENTLLTRLAFADLFDDWGIPLECVLDNGRAFASKAITGGAKSRYRFKIKDTDPTGVLTALGIRIHWALPYRGSSKPIERAWRDMCDDIAKHPAMSGAYTGNKPDAKPENYRERAIPLDEFAEHVRRRVAALNARAGRRSEAANGASFDAAFSASYETAPIGKATAEQMRLALLVAEDRSCDRHNGAVTLDGNRYWTPELHNFAGKKVTVRFDPDNLHGEIHIYRTTGEYVCAAPVIEATGFFDRAGATRRAKQEADWRRKFREAERAHDLVVAEKVAEAYAQPRQPSPTPTASVVRPVRHRGQTAAALKPASMPVEAGVEQPFLDNLLRGARLRAVGD
ncbi:transposase domain-containing protein [Sphingomonas sp. SRS2]|uniref:transposase domain-containing protein n=1 Tax=Sphingomonas sp. SRS2 TaxID=133190 RepID=UPI000695FAC3|nr:transposase domain-containing protein [Sphingomonas sp. SRS2]